jgi:hypothetical protein
MEQFRPTHYLRLAADGDWYPAVRCDDTHALAFDAAGNAVARVDLRRLDAFVCRAVEVEVEIEP